MNNTAYNIKPIPTIKNFNYLFNKRYKRLINHYNTARKVMLFMLITIAILSISNIVSMVNNTHLNQDIEDLKIYISETR